MDRPTTAPGDVEGRVDGGLDEPTGLEPEQGTLALAGDDDAHTAEDWEAAAAAVLRKARRLGDDDPDHAVWEKLTRTTLDGIAVPPLGTRDGADGVRTAGRPTRTGEWDIRARLGGAAPATLREEATADLEGGVTSLWLAVPAAPDEGWSAHLDATLDGVLLDIAPVVLDAPADPVGAARALLDHAAGRDDLDGPLDPRTNLGADPLGRALRSAGPEGPVDPVDLGPLTEVAALAADAGVLGVVVDATAVHDLGGSDAQELGYATAAGAAYLRALTTDPDHPRSAAEAAALIEFRLAATAEQFPTIAKLRAARRLWARVLELSGVEPDARAQRQHVVTSRPMMSAYDPYVNLLRTTVAAFAAGVGGADAVTVLPFDSPLGRPDAVGRRLARNTSALLISESHVARVSDPAGGAYAVERLTDDLAAAGWTEAGRLDEAGVAAALSDGSLHARVAEVVARREDDVAHRRRPLTGLSEFPDLAERRPEREPDLSAPVVRRYGASFEALRDDPPSERVLLATLGPVAAHTARATFATNLLAAGGVAVDVAGPTETAADLVAAHDGHRVVCLAGTDADYAERGAEAATALREAGADHVVVAGKPADWADDSCALGVDALAFLTRTREHLGKDPA